MPTPPTPAPTPPAAGTTLIGATPSIPVSKIALMPSFNDQCFLIEKAMDIYNVKKTESLSKISKTSPVRQIKTDEPLKKFKTNLKYANHITSMVDVKRFFEISSEKAAQLAHYANILVANRNAAAKITRKKVIFSAADHRDFDAKNMNIFQNSGMRSGAGIKSINVTYEGVDSATKKIVLVNAQFVFQDIRTMLDSKHIELFKVLTSEKIKGVKTFRTIDFEIGWSARQHSLEDENSSLHAQLGLDKLKLKLRTHIVKYTFDIQQDGSVVVNAQYRGHIVDVFGGPSSNILSMAKDTYANVKSDLERIQNRATQTAAQQAQNANDFRTNALAHMAFTRILDFGQPTGHGSITGPAPEHDEAIKKFAVDNVKFDNKFLEQRLLLIENEANKFAGSVKVAGGANFTAAEMLALDNEMKTVMNRFKVELKEAFKNNAGLSGTGKTKTARVNAVLQKFKSMATHTQRAGQAAIATAAQQQAYKNAMEEQLTRAQMARFLALQEIAKTLLDKSLINYAYIARKPTIEEFVKAAAQGPQGTPIIKSLMQGLGAKSFLAERGDPKNPISEEELDTESVQVVPFVFLGKFIENVLNLPASSLKATSTSSSTTASPAVKTVYKSMVENSGQEFTVDFGLVSYRSPYTGTEINNLPLYYFPLSLKKINDFFAREVVSKEKSFFAFNDFLLSLLRKFLTSIFGICMEEAHTTGFVAPKVQALAGQRDGQLHYFIYGFKNVVNDIKDGSITFGKYNSNFKNHIYHFYLGGQSKGAVKRVKLTDIADESTKTAVYFRNQASARVGMSDPNATGVGALPPVVFQAEVETMGFPLFNMGQLIYIDLRPYVKSNHGRQFKANGYYGVTKVTHSFTPDGFSSTVNAIIQYSLEDFQINKGSTAASSGTAVTVTIDPATSRKLKKIAVEQEDAKAKEEWIKSFIETYTEDTDAFGIAGIAKFPEPTITKVEGDTKNAEDNYKKWHGSQINTPLEGCAAIKEWRKTNKEQYDHLKKHSKLWILAPTKNCPDL